MAHLNGHTNGHAQARVDVDALKARVSLAHIIQESGIPLERAGNGNNLKGRCAFHDDQDPSLVVNPDRQLWNCFGCHTGGDVLTFLRLKENLSFPEALSRLQELAGVEPVERLPRPCPLPPINPQDALSGNLSRPQLLAQVMKLYAHRLQENREAQEYLKSRGFVSPELWHSFGLGVADGFLLSTLPAEGELRAALIELGVINNTGKEHFYGCIVVPLHHPDEGMVGLYGRRMSSTARVRHLYLPGPQRGVFNWQALQRSRNVILTESVFDALSLYQSGCTDVTCLYGVHGLPHDLKEVMRHTATQEVRFCLNADRPGREAAFRLAAELAPSGIRSMIIELPVKDANQLLTEQGGTAVCEAVARMKPLKLSEPPETDAEPQVELLDDGFTLTLGEVAYQITPRPPFAGKLRVTIKTAWEDELFVDTIDLFVHRVRTITAGQLARRLQLPKDEVERHLVLVLKETERWVARQEQAANEGNVVVRKAPEMSEEEKEEARTFLCRPDLASAILQDTDALGYVGEENAKLLAYLIGVSRRLPKPLSGIIISQSGVGKSALSELVETLTPPEDVVLYARLSPLALGYLPRDYLKRKLLILEERAGGEAADYSIRVLQSRQRFSQAVVVKDPTTGQMSTKTFEVEGPIAYLETTTNGHLNHENATRCFELTLDESEEQTRRIHQRQRESRDLTLNLAQSDQESSQDIMRRHHNAQRLLRPVLVWNTFTRYLSFPSRRPRTRRDNERFLSLMDTVAFLHQYSREGGVMQTTGGEVAYIVATMDDYRLAYQLVSDLLGATLHELSRNAQELKDAIRSLVVAVADGKRTDKMSFTRRDLREHTRWEDHRLREGLQELVTMEYVEVLTGSQGATYRYRLLPERQDDRPSLDGLTPPDELERKHRPTKPPSS